jgi:hypothetical protein
MNEFDSRWCINLFNEIIKWPIARPFLRPVDPIRDGASTYFQRITNPMDFSAIGAKLRRGQYATPIEFVDDIKLIAENAALFNGEDSMLTEFSKDVFECVQKRMSEKPSNSTQDWYLEVYKVSAAMGKLIRNPPQAVARGIRRQPGI